MAADLRIWLLGGFRAELDGRVVTAAAWRRNRARALVKLLALAPGRRLHREQVIDALWPDLDAVAGAGNLRRALHFARGALRPEVIAVHDGILTLEAEPVWVDVDAFEAAVDEGRLLAALDLYGGDLLPEDRYEPWAEDARERLASRFHRVLLAVAHDNEGRGELLEARAALERLVASDPMHEDAYLALIRVHASLGSRHEALRRYRQLEARLQDELGVGPNDAVRRLHESILDGTFTGPARAPGVETAGGRPGTDVEERPAMEERKLVTVLWADPSTSAEDPEVARRALADWTGHVTRALDASGGTAEAQAGGAVVAVFGVPVVYEDDAARALRAALAIVGSAPLPTRIGIATGDVIASVGVDAGPRSAAGDVVHEADRLRELAEPGRPLVGKRSRAIAGGTFRYGPAIRPGRDRPAAWRLLGEDRGLPRSDHREPSFVGRLLERSALGGLFDETTRTQHPRLVLLLGSAGVGKSRLVRELVRFLEARPSPPRVLRGRCLSDDRGAVYWALGEILREASGISLDEAPARVQRRLRATVQELLDGGRDGDVDDTLFALATSAGIAVPGNPLDTLPPEEVASRLGIAWPRFLTACATSLPTLVVLEDVHWASPELLDMVEQIVRRSSGPLMLLATARPELGASRPAFAALGDVVSTIHLPPLDQADSRALLRDLFAGRPSDARLHDDLLARAEGNPFYLEQLSLHVTSGGSSALPDTLQSLLSARLDSLAVRDRRLLQEASVVGRVFWEAPLVRALDEERIPERLARLERSGFVVRRPTSDLPGQAEYMFRHALLHDVAYDSLPRHRRPRAHAAVGEWLADLAGERVDELVDLIAHHFAAAIAPGSAELAWVEPAGLETVRRRAVEYLARAGDAARRRFASDRAIQLHERSLAASVDAGERIRALESLGDDHESTYHGDLAEAAYREALALARRDAARSLDRARICRKLGWIMAWNPGAFRTSPDPAVVEELVDEGDRSTDDPAERAWLQLARGAAARLYRGSEPFGQGDRPDDVAIDDRIRMVETARSAGRRLGRDDLILAGGQALGMLYGLAGRYADMLELARAEVAGLGPRHSRLDRADAIRKLAVHLINVKADFEAGLELGNRSRELIGTTNPHQAMHACWPVLVALFQLGRWDEALPVLAEHLAAFRVEPATECQFVRDGPAIGAALLTLLGRSGEAVDVAALLGDPLADRENASAWQSRYATLHGDPAAARAISSDKALEGRTYGPQHAYALLEALEALGDWDAVLAALPAARSAIEGNALLGPMVDRVEGRARLARGDVAEGVSLLQRAEAGFRTLGVPFEEARATAALMATRAGAEASEGPVR